MHTDLLLSPFYGDPVTYQAKPYRVRELLQKQQIQQKVLQPLLLL